MRRDEEDGMSDKEGRFKWRVAMRHLQRIERACDADHRQPSDNLPYGLAEYWSREYRELSKAMGRTAKRGG